MDITTVGDSECIQCGECRNVCKLNAISWKTLDKIIKEDNNISNDNQLEDASVKKDRRISKKLFTIVSGSIAFVLLVGVIIAVNFKKTSYEINEICDDLNITFVDGTKYDIKEDLNSTLLYFYDNLTIDELETIKSYSNEKLNIILVSTASNKVKINSSSVVVDSQLVDDLEKLNIRFTSDSKSNDLLRTFTNDTIYPYSVFMDFTDKILIKSNSLVSTDDYFAIIAPTVSGKTVGNQVGDICINKDINLVGSDDVFSVIDNKGKVVIINFWYTSCTPCVQELPHFDSLYKKYSDDVVVIAIHEASIYNSNPQAVKDFINSQFEGFSILFGYDDLNSQYYSILGGKQAWPMTIIVDQEGVVSFVRQGSLTHDALEAEIVKLLD